ncbi:MAG: WS/DGAT/MGAT family O-acyltransferase [Solirubrobacterales bacterium]
MSGERLSGLDSSFLHLESDTAQMHVASVQIFEPPPLGFHELKHHVGTRLHQVPRFRQKLRNVPLGQGRPLWVDDPHFNLEYHVRVTALPPPGNLEQLRKLAGRLFGQHLDRSKPLWEMWLINGLEDGRSALLSKSHHALVDGISGVDLITVLFDLEREPDAPDEQPPDWTPSPEPSDAQVLGEALVERTVDPRSIASGVGSVLRAPLAAANLARGAASSASSLLGVGLRPAPRTPLNVEIGPHRRTAWVSTDLASFKAIKNELGGTVNDVVLSAVTGALSRHMAAHGVSTVDLELKAMIPVSTRDPQGGGEIGNEVSAMTVDLPVWCEEPVRRHRTVAHRMRKVKDSEMAQGAAMITQLADFAPPTILSQAARLQPRQRLFNLVVTNVPGPQFPVYLLGRELEALFPLVPLAERQALNVGIVSYNGVMSFGLMGDYDAMADLDEFANDLRVSLDELGQAAGVEIDFALMVPGGPAEEPVGDNA